MTESSLRPIADSTGSRRSAKFHLRFDRSDSQYPIPLRPSVLDWLHRLFTTDFCPSWNRYLRCLKTPLAILLFTAVVTFVCGVIAAPQIFLLFAATVCVIAIGVVYPWIAIRFVNCRIEFSKVRIVEGDTVSSTLFVHNRWPVPVWGLTIERGFLSQPTDAPHDDDVSVALAHVPAWCRTEFAWEFTPQLRGMYPKGEVFVSTAFPFGLWSAKRRVEIAHQVVAWPFPVPVKQLDHIGHRHAIHENNSTVLAGNVADVTAIRPYRSGDMMRDIHWSVSARCDQLVVKERQRFTEHRTHIVLQVPEEIAAKLQHESSAALASTPLDWAIRLVAGLCETQVQARTPVTMEVGKQHFEIRSRREHSNAMDALSVVDLSDMSDQNLTTATCGSSDTRVQVSIVAANEDDESSALVIQVMWQNGHRLIRRQVDTERSLFATPEALHAECRRIVAALDQDKTKAIPTSKREVRHAG